MLAMIQHIAYMFRGLTAVTLIFLKSGVHHGLFYPTKYTTTGHLEHWLKMWVNSLSPHSGVQVQPPHA